MVELRGRTLLSKYRIEKLLGQGGMGSVWQGVHVLTGRKIAIKVLDERFLSNLNVVQRFGREARAASAIAHEGIVEVLDLDQTEEGVPFLVMEFLEGELLSKRIDRKGKLGQEELVRIGDMLLDALVAAHAAGVVHRDLKPDNIFLCPAGRRGEILKILDFGISSKNDEAQAKLTVTGSVLGTPHYMSPEQALGDAELDQRVDIYGAAVVFYECSVGDVPFDAANYNKLLRVILDDPAVAPRKRGADLSEPLEQVILKGMAKERDQRYGTATAFKTAWNEAAAGRATARVAPAAGADDGVAARWAAAGLSAPPPKRHTPSGEHAMPAPGARTSSSHRMPRPAIATPPAQPAVARAPEPPKGGLGAFDDVASGGSALEFDETAMPARTSHVHIPSPYPKRASEPPPAPTPTTAATGRHRAMSVPPPAPAPTVEAPLSPPWWRPWAIRGGAALVVFLLLVFGLRWLVRGTDPSDGSDVADTGVGASTDAPPQTRAATGDWVLIDITGLPPGARVRLDGLPGASLPLRVRRGSHHTVDLSAAGYVDRHLEIDGTASQTLRADMVAGVGTTQQR
jgi:serine/threonine-protein kinase